MPSAGSGRQDLNLRPVGPESDYGQAKYVELRGKTRVFPVFRACSLFHEIPRLRVTFSSFKVLIHPVHLLPVRAGAAHGGVARIIGFDDIALIVDVVIFKFRRQRYG